MGVVHILKDGSSPKDITGYVVKISDAESLYQFIHNMNSKYEKSSIKKEVRVC